MSALTLTVLVFLLIGFLAAMAYDRTLVAILCLGGMFATVSFSYVSFDVPLAANHAEADRK